MASRFGLNMLLAAFAVAQLAHLAQATRPGPMLIVLQGPLDAFGADRSGPFQMVREMPQQQQQLGEDPFALLDRVFADRHSLFGPAFGPQLGGGGGGPMSPFELFGPQRMPPRRRCGNGQPMAHPDMLQHLAHARFGPGLLSALLDDARRGGASAEAQETAYAPVDSDPAQVTNPFRRQTEYYTSEGSLEDAAFAYEAGDLAADADDAAEWVDAIDDTEPTYRILPVRKEKAEQPVREWAAAPDDADNWEIEPVGSATEVEWALAEESFRRDWKQEAAEIAQEAEHGSWGFTKRLGQAHLPSNFFSGSDSQRSNPATVTHRTRTASGLSFDARQQQRQQDADVEWTLFGSDDQVDAGALIFLGLCVACIFVWARLIVLACSFNHRRRGCGKHHRSRRHWHSGKEDRAAHKAAKAARRAGRAADDSRKTELEQPLLNPLNHEAPLADDPYRVEVAASHAPSAPAGYVTLQYVPLRSEQLGG